MKVIFSSLCPWTESILPHILILVIKLHLACSRFSISCHLKYLLIRHLFSFGSTIIHKTNISVFYSFLSLVHEWLHRQHSFWLGSFCLSSPCGIPLLFSSFRKPMIHFWKLHILHHTVLVHSCWNSWYWTRWPPNSLSVPTHCSSMILLFSHIIQKRGLTKPICHRNSQIAHGHLCYFPHHIELMLALQLFLFLQ